MKPLAEDVKEILKEHGITVRKEIFGDGNHTEVMLVRDKHD